MAAGVIRKGHSRSKRRELTSMLFLVALVISVIALAVMLLWFSAPRAETIMIGTLTDFPPGDQAYEIAEGNFYAYVVNIGGELIVFDAHTPHYTHYRYKWVPLAGRFEDPLTASKFALDGTWLVGPAPRDLDRFPYTIRDGRVYVETWRTIKGTERDVTQPGR